MSAPVPAILDQLSAAAGNDPAELSKTYGKVQEEHNAPRELFEVKESSSGGKTFLVIRQDQLEKTYMFSATLDRGTGEKEFFSSWPDETFLWYLSLAGDKLQLRRRNVSARAEPGSPEAKSLAMSYPDAILAVIPIAESDEKAKTVAVSSEEWFLEDLLDYAGRLRAAYQDAHHELQHDRKASRIKSLRAFPKNMEVKAQLLFVRHKSGGSAVLNDARIVPITVHYSLAVLPDRSSFQERKADPRVGYFTTSFKDYTSADLKGKSEPIVSLINRWNLEKVDPSAAISDVKKPVVLWLEDTIPHEYRPALRAGILAWNQAFESIGLRNALVVKEVDKDMSEEERKSFDPSDASYNMVRWFMGEDSGMAIGPSRANPLTGEIFQGSIHFSDLMTRFITTGQLELDAKATPPAHACSAKCPDHSAMAEKVRRAAANLALLERDGSIPQEERRRYLDEFLTETMAHEMGHVLGLRHNFKGSTMLPLEELGKDGWLSSTVMDYLPANPNAKIGASKPYFQTKIGPYDYWAVEYGYKPQAAASDLKAIADRSALDPLLAYGTDEDVNGYDPDTQRFDQGKGGPLPLARSRVQAARRLWAKLETRPLSTAQDYASLEDSFRAGMGEFFRSVDSVVPVIGGIRAYRDAAPNGIHPSPFEVVAGREQREALSFLDREVFSADPFKISPWLLSRLSEERKPYESNTPFPLAGYVQRLQASALQRLHSPATLRRLSTSELYAAGQDILTISELLRTVRESIWREISSGSPAPVHLFRRNLQRAHIDTLAGTLYDRESPTDAKASARQNLLKLERDLAAAVKANGRDAATQGHLEEMLDLLRRRLRPVPDSAARPLS